MPLNSSTTRSWWICCLETPSSVVKTINLIICKQCWAFFCCMAYFALKRVACMRNVSFHVLGNLNLRYPCSWGDVNDNEYDIRIKSTTEIKWGEEKNPEESQGRRGRVEKQMVVSLMNGAQLVVALGVLSKKIFIFKTSAFHHSLKTIMGLFYQDFHGESTLLSYRHWFKWGIWCWSLYHFMGSFRVPLARWQNEPTQTGMGCQFDLSQ